MTDEIIEGNKLIAEFMGAKGFTFVDDFNYPCEAIKIGETIYHARSLKYNSSWDWLMPVVKLCKEKFVVLNDSMDKNFGYERINKIYDKLITIEISTTWLAVIDFIKWYNTLKTNSMNIEKLWNQNSITADADKNIHTDYMTKEVFLKIFEQFKAEQKQSAGVWVKASERLPEQKKQVCGKLNGKPAIVWNSNLTEGYITANGNLERIEDVEWLDETIKQTV